MRRLCFALTGLAAALSAQTIPPKLYSALEWRTIGPFRGGRTVGAAGIAGQPNVFYIGVNNGGVWKTDDFGHTWRPIFDDQATGSIGAVAVAPSDPKIVYVGSGEGLQRPDLSVGDGMYKSTDGGQTWRHLGLRDGQQIAAILVDPRNANRVLVAVLGHPYGPNAERGVFRSTDGGESWQKVLYKDEHTGAVDLAFDPRDPQTVYAVLWQARQGPWENGAFSGPASGLFKSTDGGTTWNQLTGGLPAFAQGLGRIGIGIAPSDGQRMYALVEARDGGGLYRSDDAGGTWRRVSTEQRIYGRGSDFACVRVDPRNKDVIYVANTSTYRSTDAGESFTAIKGAPGGDDYHTIWINPNNPDIILLASDQGATISVNYGKTWSSWYNQPTAQFYHVITDHQLPYWVYGGQQESGSAAVASRGNDGQITFREWHPVGAAEYAYLAPDPLDPNIVYGGGMGNAEASVTRYNRTTGEVEHVGPRGSYRHLRTFPVLFSEKDPHILYVGMQAVLKTADGGKSWEAISPDLSRESYDVPASVASFGEAAKRQATRRGVVYAIAPSPLSTEVIWAGTDDGLVHATRDGGKSWQNVTPPGLAPWSKVSQLDASHFDDRTVYAAVNSIRLDDQRPHIWRTHDGGATWQEIVRGLPDGPVNTVREDPVKQGLLFAGTELAVYVSFNDGGDWQPLRLNMPATSIRDLVIHDGDVVVGTHGRGFWILDDMTPLRQMTAETAGAAAHLFAPRLAWRYPRNTNTDTPLPPEEPAGKNPPDGATLYYYLKDGARDAMTLEIFDAAGKLVQRFASTDQPEPPNPQLNVTTYWIRPFQPLSVEAGMHRFVWDLHAARAPGGGGRGGYPISAIYQDTPGPQGPWAPPGAYTVKLTVDGQSYTQPLEVKPDPRASGR
ncbi:MAG: glycoside hydrolase [Acidobacteriia bacterium]|nr:glycoside hydrolase [Terriglobia bacterium]